MEFKLNFKSGLKNKFILAFFSFLFSIIMFEVFLRAIDKPRIYKRHTNPPQFAFVRINEDEWAYFNTPSTSINFIYDGNPRGYFKDGGVVQHITNSWGFRGQEFTFEKPSMTFRICFLGDSYTFGEGVHQNDIYPQVTARLLNEKYASSGITFQAYNFGVGGYNIDQELFILKSMALKAQPDAVVVKADVGDGEPALFEMDKRTKTIVRIPRWYENNQTHKEVWWQATGVNLRLLQLIKKISDDRRQNRLMLNYYTRLSEGENPSWGKNMRSLYDIIEICRTLNIPCYVLYFPIPYRLKYNYPFAKVHQEIQKQVEEKGGVFIDLIQGFRCKDAPAWWVHPTDQHPNDAAHNVAARMLVKQMSADRRFKDKVKSLTGGGKNE